MVAIVRQNFAQALLPFVGEWIGLDYEPKKSVREEIFEVFKMDHEYYQDFMSYGAGLMTETGENSPFNYDQMAQTWFYTYTAFKYMTGFLISFEAMEDQKYINLGKLRSRETKKSIEATHETLCAYVLNNAFNGNVTYGDGQSLISSAHPIGIGPNQSNRPTSYTDLDELSLEQAVIDIADIRDERGIRMNHEIESLIVPQQLVFEAHRILNSDLQSNTAQNNTNALKDMGSIPKVIMWNYLTNAKAWFVKLNNPNGLKYGIRTEPKLEGDNDFNTKAARFSVLMRSVAGASDTLRSIYASNGP